MKIQTTTFAAAIIAIGAAAPAATQGPAPIQYRYDFTIRVTENLVIGSGLEPDHPELAALGIGTVGTYSVLVTPNDGLPDDPDSGWWQQDEAAVSIGGIEAITDPALYPSTFGPRTFGVFNDLSNSGDLIQAFSGWLDAPAQAGLLIITDLDNADAAPIDRVGDLLDDDQLPTAIDLTNDGVSTRFILTYPTGEDAVRHEIIAADVTIIPAPATLALLTPAAALLARRRR